VADKFIDESELAEFCSGVSVFIGFNSSWIRPFMEIKYPDIFNQTAWMSLNKEIDWQGELGIVPNMQLIAQYFGFHYSSHIGTEECYAMQNILSEELLPGKKVFSMMLDNARGTSFMFILSPLSGNSFSKTQKEYMYNNRWRWRKGISIIQDVDGKPSVAAGYINYVDSPEKGKLLFGEIKENITGANIRVGEVTPLEKYKGSPTIRRMIS